MVKAVKSVIQTTEAVAQFLIVLDLHVFNRLSDEGTFQKQAFRRSLSQPKSFENGGRGHFGVFRDGSRTTQDDETFLRRRQRNTFSTLCRRCQVSDRPPSIQIM